MVTIVDVARAAGVAPSTVSYVLNGKRPISADTRRQVEQCIRELGYRPDRRAPTTRPRANVLGLLAPLRPGANLPALTRFVTATMVAARGRDQDLLLLTHDTDVSELRRTVATTVADALIVMDVAASDPRVPALLAVDRPVVLVGTPARLTVLSSVDVDFTAAAVRAAAHLANLGHRSVGILGAAVAERTHGADHPRRFTQAFELAAGQRGLRTRRRACEESAEAVQRCLDTLIADDPETTALVVENEAVLPVVIEHLRCRGQRVPEDVSVIAVRHDETPERPPIRFTSVTVPTVELGRLAVELALHQLDGRPLDGQAAPETKLISAGLTVRESTAPATLSRA